MYSVLVRIEHEKRLTEGHPWTLMTFGCLQMRDSHIRSCDWSETGLGGDSRPSPEPFGAMRLEFVAQFTLIIGQAFAKRVPVVKPTSTGSTLPFLL